MPGRITAGMKKSMVKDKAAGGRSPEKDVDDYLAGVPKASRTALEKLRRIIRAAAPKASEKISYGMPVFYHDGMLVGFAAFKDHCSFFPMSVETMKAFRNELKGFDTLKGTVRFTAGKPLPAALVKRIVRARVLENAERALIRRAKKR